MKYFFEEKIGKIIINFFQEKIGKLIYTNHKMDKKHKNPFMKKIRK